MDPALPLFGDKDDSQRIDPSDAQFVDVIHTAMGKLPSGLAFTEPRGHVDFYVSTFIQAIITLQFIILMSQHETFKIFIAAQFW